MTPRNPADRPATEPRTDAEVDLCDVLYHSEFHISREQAAISGRLMYDAMLARGWRFDRAEAAQGAAPLPEFHDLLTKQEWREAFGLTEGAAPRAEGLREALEHVLDVWPAPSPEEFARLHRVLIGHDSCSSRPSDERVPESEEPR